MKGEIELYNISFLILKVNLHFKEVRPAPTCTGATSIFASKLRATSLAYIRDIGLRLAKFGTPAGC